MTKVNTTTEITTESTISISGNRSNVKLPKLKIKTFSGEPMEWQSFKETFSSAVDANENLTKIEKFTYLKGLLDKAARKTIQGFSLTNENYYKAMKLLEERFGNPQTIISSHMASLLKIKAIFSEKDLKAMRALHDTVETHIRSLNSLGIDSVNYGALLAPIVMEKLPHQVRLIISRNMKEDWNIDTLLELLKTELMAR